MDHIKGIPPADKEKIRIDDKEIVEVKMSFLPTPISAVMIIDYFILIVEATTVT